jgi:hypothetical protein
MLFEPWFENFLILCVSKTHNFFHILSHNFSGEKTPKKVIPTVRLYLPVDKLNLGFKIHICFF